MAKKVAIVFSGAKYRGGMETYLINLFSYVDKSKVELNLFSLGQWDLVKRIEALGFSPKVFSARRIRIKTIFEIAKELRKGRYDLVVSQGVVANTYARAASIFSGVPNLITVHSALTHDYSNLFIKFCYFTIDRLLRWRTKEYITVSEFLKTNLVKSGIDEKRVTVIYNGLDQMLAINGQTQDKNKKNQIIIGSIGRLHSVKNYSSLIRAISLLNNKKIKLEIAGDGPERVGLEKMIIELGLSDQVTLLGHIDNINDLFPRWDIYIQPSLSEGFGLTVVEAMTAGLPVIVTPKGALTEIVEDGKSGIITKNEEPKGLMDAVQKLINNRSLAQKLGSKAAVLVKEKFDIQTWAERTVDKYLEACENDD